MSDQMRLRWTSHQGTILSVFDALLASESLVDVTLACEGQYLRAHKLILTACSPYFQELLNVDLNKHPIFFLKDVKFKELQALVQYMYRGEVNIAQADLTSLLEVAQALKIRGLSDVETTSNSISSDTIILPDLRQTPKPPPPLNPTVTPISQPPPVPMASTSNVHFPRNFQQTSYGSPNGNPTIRSPIIASAVYSAPPPAKKTRIETATRPSASAPTVQVQQQTQLQHGDPRIVVHRLPFSAQSDPLQPGSRSPSLYSEKPVNGNQWIDEVKVEDSEHENLDMNLTEEYDEENTMSQSGFSDSWQSGEADTSEVADNDDGEVPTGSDGNKESGTGCRAGAEGGEGILVDGKKRFACNRCGRTYALSGSLRRHHRLECGVQVGKFKCAGCGLRSKWFHNLKVHEATCSKKLARLPVAPGGVP